MGAMAGSHPRAPATRQVITNVISSDFQWLSLHAFENHFKGQATEPQEHEGPKLGHKADDLQLPEGQPRRVSVWLASPPSCSSSTQSHRRAGEVHDPEQKGPS